MARTPVGRSPAYQDSRQVAYSNAQTQRDRSPPRRPRSPAARSPPGPEYRQRSPRPPPRREPQPIARDDYRDSPMTAGYPESQREIPSGPSYRNGDSRPAPNAPAYQDRFAREASSPSGAPMAPISMSAHNRPPRGNLLAAPTRPRGGYHGHDQPHPRDISYGAPRGRGGYRGGLPPPRPSYGARSPIDGPPLAPRSGYPTSSRYDDHRDSGPVPPFRNNNSSSTTYPRTQRFNTHIADLPRPIPGGKINNAGLDPASEKRLQDLEDQKRKLLDVIDKKQEAKRKALREWERGEAEVKRDGLKSELAQSSLEGLTGEGGGVVGNAF
ncbi:MAG: hypothetical protein Q9174_001960 [Haloplaca sp. 1 TL-2023]